MGLGAVGSESEHGWVALLRKSHPASHGVDDVLVSVHSGVDTLFPVATISGVVSAGVGVEGLAVLHGLAAAVTLVTSAVVAVGQTIWESSSSIVHEGVGGEEGLDLPVTISSLEQLLLKVSVHIDVLILNENRSFVSHISG